MFEEVPEGFIGYVEGLPGANTQAPTMQEARADLAEAVELVLEANRCSPRSDRSAGRSSASLSVPRHREINDFLARKICRDLDVVEP